MDENELAGFLDGGLTAQDRRRIEAHLETCSECRDELVAMRRILEADAPGTRVSRMARRWWIPVTVAAALGVLLLTPHSTVGPARRGDAERSLTNAEGQARITVVAPRNGAVVASGPVAFTWRSSGADMYRVTLLSEDGQPLWTQNTADTTVSLPQSVSLEKGRSYFWRVDAIANGIAASTATQILQVAP